MIMEEMQEAVEGVVEDIHQMQDPEHLPSGMEESAYYGQPRLRSVCSAPLLGTTTGNIEDSTSAPFSDLKRSPPKKSASIPSLINSIGGSGPYATTSASDSEYEQGLSIHPSHFCETDEDGEYDEHEPPENQALLRNNDLSSNDSKNKDYPGENSSSLLSNGSIASPERMEYPTLALTQTQFEMIQELDTLGFQKFPVWIHNDTHTHAAIIVRRPRKKSWAEGKVVVRHWVEEMFVA